MSEEGNNKMPRRALDALLRHKLESALLLVPPPSSPPFSFPMKDADEAVCVASMTCSFFSEMCPALCTAHTAARSMMMPERLVWPSNRLT